MKNDYEIVIDETGRRFMFLSQFYILCCCCLSYICTVDVEQSKEIYRLALMLMVDGLTLQFTARQARSKRLEV